MIDKQASQERVAASANGFVYVAIGVLAILVSAALLLSRPSPALVGLFCVGMLVGAWCLAGLYMLQPNQAALLTLFGSYRSEERRVGKECRL